MRHLQDMIYMMKNLLSKEQFQELWKCRPKITKNNYHTMKNNKSKTPQDLLMIYNSPNKNNNKVKIFKNRNKNKNNRDLYLIYIKKLTIEWL